MHVTITSEHRFNRTPDGRIWTQVAFAYSFWSRYLHAFDHVKVLARIFDVPDIGDGWQVADGPDVSFIAIPHYIGPWQYFLKLKEIKEAIISSSTLNDAVIMRIPSQIAIKFHRYNLNDEKPFGVEVVGDPHDVFAPGAVKHPLRFFFRWWFTRKMKQQCSQASAAAYVTQRMLQKSYPPSADFTTHYSSIELEATDFALASRSFVPNKQVPLNIIYVGTLSQLYKSPDLLIDSFSKCIKTGLNLRLIVVGDGKYRQELEKQTELLGVSEQVTFVGQLKAGHAVRSQLDRADIFVLPSLQEGLPRAMIEAMARGLPCIGSTVGGIPELLLPDDMVPPGAADALTKKIIEVVKDPARMCRMSERNLQVAQDYREDILQNRRAKFYKHVRQVTEEWLAAKVNS